MHSSSDFPRVYLTFEMILGQDPAPPEPLLPVMIGPPPPASFDDDATFFKLATMAWSRSMLRTSSPHHAWCPAMTSSQQRSDRLKWRVMSMEKVAPGVDEASTACSHALKSALGAE